MAVVCFGFGCFTSELSRLMLLLVFISALSDDNGEAMTSIKVTAEGYK